MWGHRGERFATLLCCGLRIRELCRGWFARSESFLLCNCSKKTDGWTCFPWWWCLRWCFLWWRFGFNASLYNMSFNQTFIRHTTRVMKSCTDTNELAIRWFLRLATIGLTMFIISKTFNPSFVRHTTRMKISCTDINKLAVYSWLESIARDAENQYVYDAEHQLHGTIIQCTMIGWPFAQRMYLCVACEKRGFCGH